MILATNLHYIENNPLLLELTFCNSTWSILKMIYSKHIRGACLYIVEVNILKKFINFLSTKQKIRLRIASEKKL